MDIYVFIDALIENVNEASLFSSMQQDCRAVPYLLQSRIMEKIIEKRMWNIFSILLTGTYGCENFNEVFHTTISRNQLDYAEMILNSGKLDATKVTNGKTILDCVLSECVSIPLIDRVMCIPTNVVTWSTIEIAAVRYPQCITVLLGKLTLLSVTKLLFTTQNSYLKQVIFQYIDNMRVETRSELFFQFLIELSKTSKRKEAIPAIHVLLSRPAFTLDHRLFESVVEKSNVICCYTIDYLASHEKIINAGGMALINWYVEKALNKREK